MKKTGIREARQNLSSLIEEVRKGHEILITDRGRPVACLVPVPLQTAEPFRGKSAFRQTMPSLRPTLSESILEDREDQLELSFLLVLDKLNLDRQAPAEPLPKRKEPQFDLRSALYTLIGADLSQIHGSLYRPASGRRVWRRSEQVAQREALHILVVSGARKQDIGGGRVLNSKTRRPSNRASPPANLPPSTSEKLKRRWAPSIVAVPLVSGKPRPSPRPPGSWPYCSIARSASG